MVFPRPPLTKTKCPGLNAQLSKKQTLAAGGRWEEGREAQALERSWADKGSPGALPWLVLPDNRSRKGSGRKKEAEMGQTRFSEMAPNLHCWIQVSPRRGQGLAKTEVNTFPLNISIAQLCWGWLVKTWDTCIIQNPLGDRDQLGP